MELRPAATRASPLATLTVAALLCTLLVSWPGGPRGRAAALLTVQQADVGPRARAPLVGGVPSCEAAAGAAPAIDGCLEVTEVCVDQQEVVMMGQEYIPDPTHPSWARGAVKPLPSFDPGFEYIPQLSQESNGDFYTGGQKLPPVTFRWRSSREASPDLQRPLFDGATLPIILHPTWQFNHGHVLMSTMSWVYNNVNQSSPELAQHAQLAIRTPHGLGMAPFMRPLLEPLLDRPLVTFAELSQRPAPGTERPPARCFCRMLLCRSYPHTESPNVWHAAQALAQTYLPHPQPAAPSRSVRGPAPAPAAEPRPAAGAAGTTAAAGTTTATAAAAGGPAAAAGTAAAGAGGQQPRSVVFHTRSEEVRQFTNLRQLLSKCSEWRPAAGTAWAAAAAGAAGARQPTQCGTHTFTDVASSVAAARSADVFVAVHGASVPNAFFMRPGSALVEILHPDWPHRHNWLLEQDPAHELIYFGLLVHPSAWTPGAFEREQKEAGLKPYNGFTAIMHRDRNVELRWEWLEPVLDQIAELGGDMAAYRRLVAADKVMLRVGFPPK